MTRLGKLVARSMRRSIRPAIWATVACGTVGAVLLFAMPSLAQQVVIDFAEEGGTVTARVVQLIAFLTVISLAPSLL
ncbi:MAG: flagellar biosynthetic protein FliP, partial [Alphaproteobacteria bacterium]|nr:flagellar biosynthetic protein FliP [Alphaproteobacteria bacterium]